MSPSIILRQDAAGRMSVARDPRGKAEWTSQFSADNEASRMRFREDGVAFCVYTGLFASATEAHQFCQLLAAGKSIENAWRTIKEQRS